MSALESHLTGVTSPLSGLNTVFSLLTGPTSMNSWISGGEDRGSSSGSGNKTARSAVKAVIAEATKLNWVRKVSGSAAVAFCPDFFEAMPKAGKLRDKLWQTVEETPQVLWFVVISRLERIADSLPPFWNERPYPNVCLIAVLDDDQDATDRDIEVLKKIPARLRGVLPKPECDFSVIKSELSGIDYAIVPALASSDTFSQGSGPELIDQGHEACEADGLQIVRISSVEDGGSTLVDDFQNDFEPYLPRLVNRRKPRALRPGKRSPRPTAKPTQVEVATLSALAAYDLHSSEPEASVVTATDLVHRSPEDHPLTQGKIFTGTKLEQFELLDGTVRNGIRAVVEAGLALQEIRDGELWREVGYPNWNAYCESIVEWSRAYVNRLICHAVHVSELREDNPPLAEDGLPILPVGESLSRPLHKLEDRKKRAKAWRTAVKQAGGLPTAKIVMAAVSEIMSANKSAKPVAPSRKEQRMELLRQLRQAANSASSWDEVRELVNKLEAIK